MNIADYIKNNRLKIIVRPNSNDNEILGYDELRSAVKVSIKAKPEDNKANIEVIRFFKKLLKKDVKIMTGLKNKEKILKIM